jgi:hypothetical protein
MILDRRPRGLRLAPLSALFSIAVGVLLVIPVEPGSDEVVCIDVVVDDQPAKRICGSRDKVQELRDALHGREEIPR